MRSTIIRLREETNLSSLKSLGLVSNRTGNWVEDKLSVRITYENIVHGHKHAREDEEMGHGMGCKEAKL